MTRSNEDRTSKGGRPRTGTIIKLSDGRLQGIVTLADGSRKRLPPFPRGTSLEMAKERTTHASELAAKSGKRGSRPSVAKETAAGWVQVWHSDRVARGLTSADVSLGHWTHHIAAVLGSKHPREWTREDFRRLATELDEKVQGDAIAWKTAANVWGTATKMASDASDSKVATLRCRDDNPAESVRGPDRGNRTGLQYLYPSELLRFVECERVPLTWRRLVAVAVYTYMRSGELRALHWSDVDLEHGTISITKSFSVTTGKLKATKSRTPRLIPIEPALLPLLQAMHDESGGRGDVFAMAPRQHLSESFKRLLKVAGVDRPALFERGPGVAPIRFHDLRSTGVTWEAVRGTQPLTIMQRAGHANFETTQRYLRAAEVLKQGFGQPFPELSVSLQPIDRDGESALFSAGKLVGGTGFEPATLGL